MAKSKQVGNLKTLINKKTEEKKKEEKEKLFDDIEHILIPNIVVKSEDVYVLDTTKARCYNELMRYLHKNKALNIEKIKELIKKESED